jgi:hypothetical protein
MPNIEHSSGDTPHRSEDRVATAPGAAGVRADAQVRFLALLRQALADLAFDQLVLAKPTAAAGDMLRVGVREVALGERRVLSFVHRHATRDVTKNLGLEAGVAAIEGLLGAAFCHGHLFTNAIEAELRIGRRGRAGLSVVKATRAAGPAGARLAHDRAKRRWVALDRPYLAGLGVTDPEGRLVPAMARKWKQINKFVEVFDHAFESSALRGRERFDVVDFGSGKGYLTFALHDHLRHARRIDAEVAGIELRADLVALCNGVANDLALDGLTFVHGDVRSVAPSAIDVMIALHACDTATDHALHAGVRAGAEIILCSPCCHKELRPQMRSPAPLGPMLQHGIHLGQQAEMVTDTLRALRLEAEGYATQVFEFVALEHTHKNKMILATRKPARAAERAAALAQIAEIKSFYGIRTQCLEALLEADPAR